MAKANDRDMVRVQYNSDKNLNARQALHMVSVQISMDGLIGYLINISLSLMIELLNLVVGMEVYGPIIEIGYQRILTDLSEGMLRLIRDNLLGIDEVFDYSVVDNIIFFKGTHEFP